MFRKKYTIGGKINKGFLIESDYLLIQQDSSLKKINLSNGETITSSKINDGLNIQKIEKLENGYIGLANGKICFLDNDLKLKGEKKLRFSGYDLLEEKFLIKIIDYDYTTFKGIYGVFDLSTGEDLWRIDTGESIKIESNIVFTISPNGIRRRDIVQGEIKWSLEMNNGTLLPELIGVSNDLVIFAFQENSKLIALDIETGTIKWEIKTLTKGLSIDKEKGLLHQMMVNYAAYDLFTGELKVNYQDSSYFESIGIESQRSNYVLYGDYLITTDWKNGVVGAFNTLTHKFDWVHEEEGVSFPSPVPLNYKSPYLLIHDNKGILHIFERE